MGKGGIVGICECEVVEGYRGICRDLSGVGSILWMGGGGVFRTCGTGIRVILLAAYRRLNPRAGYASYLSS